MTTSESFTIHHSHGQDETGIDSYDEAIARVQAVYGVDCSIGHDGDISEGGERTLVWVDEETGRDDDGSRACCSIRRRHA